MCAIEVTPTIGTERLLLRGPVPRDAEQMCEVLNDFNVAAMTAAVPHPYGPADAEAWIERAMRQDWATRPGFLIEHRHFGVVGALAFRPGDQGRPDLGFWLGRRYWNRGYATEAVRGALKWANRDWRKNVVVAGHFSDNPASGQVLCKAGFLYTGDVALTRSAARGQDVPTRMMVWLA